MDDLETTVVITPAIPLDDMTPLERLVLSHVFDAGETDEGLLLYSDHGAAKLLNIPTTQLATAYTASWLDPIATSTRLSANAGPISKEPVKRLVSTCPTRPGNSS